MKAVKKAIAIASLSFFLFSCASTHYHDTSYGYGTFWNYHLYEGSNTDVEDLISLVSETSIANEATSSYQSGIAAINEKGVATIDDWLVEELRLGVDLQKKTDGYFSLFSGRLNSLWLDNLNEGKTPKESEISAEVASIAETYLVFDGNTVTKVGDAKLDLGALGKGFCLELAKRELKRKGISKYWLSGGGSSISLGENPFGKEGKTKVEFEDLPGKYVYVKDLSLSVSSCRKQLYEVGGKRYSHIVDPFSGSAEVDVDAVIAFGENAAILDALTTAAYLCGEAKAKEIEKEFNVRFLVIRDEKVIYSSHGIELEG